MRFERNSMKKGNQLATERTASVMRESDKPVAELARGITPRIQDKDRERMTDDGRPFCHNTISTTKFTGWNFVPKVLFYLLSQLTYWIITLDVVLDWSAVDTARKPYWSVTLLVSVMVVNMIKELISDKKRAASDYQQNQVRCTKIVIDESVQHKVEYTEIPLAAHQVRVGDILRIRDEQVIPADCVILTSHSALPERQAMKLKPGAHPIGDIMISTALLDG